MGFKPGQPVLIASVNSRHGLNITMHKQTVATILSAREKRYYVEFKNGSKAHINAQYLEAANQENHARYSGWSHHYVIREDVEKSELKCADEKLKELCAEFNVCLSVTNGQITLVDKCDLDNQLVINEHSHL